MNSYGTAFSVLFAGLLRHELCQSLEEDLGAVERMNHGLASTTTVVGLAIDADDWNTCGFAKTLGKHNLARKRHAGAEDDSRGIYGEPQTFVFVSAANHLVTGVTQHLRTRLEHDRVATKIEDIGHLIAEVRIV